MKVIVGVDINERKLTMFTEDKHKKGHYGNFQTSENDFAGFVSSIKNYLEEGDTLHVSVKSLWVPLNFKIKIKHKRLIIKPINALKSIGRKRTGFAA